jgi:transcriptional regulator with XRE-family HTH domain
VEHLDSLPIPDKGYPHELKTLGDHLKACRLDLGLYQKQVALMLGVDADSIKNWENGRCKIEVRYYPALISFLNYNPLPEAKSRGEAIARERMSRGLSRRRLAALTGVDPATVRRLEADRPRTAKRPARVICRFLGLEIV